MNKIFNKVYEKLTQYNSLSHFKNTELLMSGTSAIHFAVQDILLKHPNIQDVYLPSYRCECIDVPFKDSNLNIYDYEINYDTTAKKFYANIPDIKNCVLFLCDFYIHTNTYQKIIEECKLNNVIIIYDITHTFFCDNLIINNCDYVVASLRKWFKTVDGGIVLSNENFINKSISPNRKYLFYKKLDYCLGRFKKLSLFKKLKNWAENKADMQAEKFYQNRKLSTKTAKFILKTNIDEMLLKRKINANLLGETLNQECLIQLKQNALLSYPYLFNINSTNTIEQLRNCNIRCANFWGNYNFDFENNICFDLNQEFTEYKLNQLLKIVRNK